MVLTWKKTACIRTALYRGNESGLVADDSTNPWAFTPSATGLHQAAASKYWYYYVNGAEKYPPQPACPGRQFPS